jgi:HEAT repeat protein
MLQTVELLRRVLVPFLFMGGSLLGVLLAYLVIQRVVRELAWRRRQTLVTRYRPVIDAITQFGPTPQSLERLRRAPALHRRIIAGLLLAPLHAARGDLVSHVRDAAVAMGLVEDWLADLRNRRWWVRADGVRALGFVEERSALPAITRALEDDHEEVRAAAVEAAGRLGDPRAIPALLEHLADGSRYQRVRVVDALRSLGPLVTPALVELARARPDHARLAADVLGLIGTPAAIAPLLQWCGDSRSEVRAAALGALGSIGLDDRSYHFALRALGDSDPQARAMAARALGRGLREDAVGHLAERLDDEWLPAAQAAWALRRLGGAGLAALQARAGDGGQAGDLARQMLWSRQPIGAQA